MAVRLIALLPLLASCISASSGIANQSSTPEAADMGDTLGTAEILAPVADPVPGTSSIISHAQANSVIQAAVNKAIEIKMPSNVAVTDPYGHLVSFLRMDGAVLVSIDVAIKKAKTVSLFGGKYRSGDLYNATGPGGPLYGISQTNSGLIFFGGGVPLKYNGNVVGALGVSGGTADQDVQIATAAAAALK